MPQQTETGQTLPIEKGRATGAATDQTAATIATPHTFEVQQFTICDGWINNWIIVEEGGTETPETFASFDEASAALDEFLDEIDEEIAIGQRDPDQGFGRDEFRIVPAGVK